MPPGNDQEKTEQATPKKRQEALEKGQIAKSRELCSVAVLLSALLGFHFVGGAMFGKLMEFTRFSLSHLNQPELSEAGVLNLMKELLLTLAVIVGPILGLMAAGALFSNLVQTGFVFSSESLTPDLAKLDPIKGFFKLASLRSVMEMVKSVFKLVIVGGVAFLTVKGEMDEILPLVDVGIWTLLVFICKVSFTILVRTCWVLLVLAVLDYAYQKWEHEKGLKMSKQEVKDEYKQTEGDPMVRSRIRGLQREMARRRMMEQVPKADVVITNPTHFAIALKYEKDMGAPVVLAKGAGHIAEKIKEIAKKHKVPMVENKTVARLLYKVCNVGTEIPQSLYRAVAEILAHVYRLRGKNGR